MVINVTSFNILGNPLVLDNPKNPRHLLDTPFMIQNLKLPTNPQNNATTMHPPPQLTHYAPTHMHGPACLSNPNPILPQVAYAYQN